MRTLELPVNTTRMNSDYTMVDVLLQRKLLQEQLILIAVIMKNMMF